MGTIKLKRGTGSPAGSIAANEVAMDVAAKNLYTSTNGSDAVVLADNTENFLGTNTTELDITSDIDMNDKDVNGVSQLAFKLGGADPSITYTANSGSAFNFQSLKINTVYDPNLSPDLSASNSAFQISNRKDAGNNFLNRWELLTENSKSFFGIFVEDTGGGDDGSHSTIFSLKGSDSSSVYNQLQSFTSASGTPGPTRLDITGSAVSFYGNEYILPTSDGTNGQLLKTDGAGNLSFSNTMSTDIDMDNNNLSDVKQITAKASAYNEVSQFRRIASAGAASNASLELERDYGSSDPATGLDPRGAGFSFTVISDNYNNIYPGVFYGKSGGKDQNAGVENTVGMSAYGGAADSYAEFTILEGNRNACNMEVPVRFPSYTTTERNALTNVVNGMQVYNTTDSKMQAYAGGAWVDLH